MAFITKTSYLRFCREIEVEFDDNQLLETFKKYILDDENISNIFNKNEIKSLLVQTIILLDETERNKALTEQELDKTKLIAISHIIPLLTEILCKWNGWSRKGLMQKSEMFFI